MVQLVVKQGPALGTTFQVERQSVVLGRDRASDVYLPDETISRSHARGKEGACQGGVAVVCGEHVLTSHVLLELIFELLPVGDRDEASSTPF